MSDPLVEELAFRLFIIGLLNTKEKGLCGSLCHLCTSVVNLFSSDFTTETQSITEFAEKYSFRQTLLRAKSFIAGCESELN